MRVRLPEVIGGGYGEFWRFQGRYRVVKGGRGSKKSTTAALWFIYSMMKYYRVYGLKPSLLVLRRYYCDHRETTFEQLQWAIRRLGVSHLWQATKSPLQLRFIPSGQKIIFRGLDKPQSINSITSKDGSVCWVWWEEAFQVSDEDAFNKVDLSIRGDLEAPLFKQHTLTMNPWSEKSWIKRRFFDEEHGDVLALTRNYDCNEFLGFDDVRLFEEMRSRSPKRYAIEGLGQWGISEGLIYENWEEREFEFGPLVSRSKRESGVYESGVYGIFGLDFGYSNDPTAFIAAVADSKRKELYIGHEVYKTGMLNGDIFRAIQRLGYQHELIIADSAEPKSIAELKRLGLSGIQGAKKGPDSVNAGIQKLQDYRFFVHPRCVNTIVELSNYTWSKERLSGRLLNVPVDDYNHAMDALRYGAENLHRRDFSWS